jgi:hypothetical protein
VMPDDQVVMGLELVAGIIRVTYIKEEEMK